MSILTGEDSLSRIIDDHIDWFVTWTRLACVATSGRAERAASMTPPSAFNNWFKGPARQLPQDQPVIDRLAVLHDQLHTLARLVLMKAPDGAAVSEADYDAVAGKYQAFITGVRHLERAFAIAASGLDLLTGLRSRVGMMEELIREQNRFERMGKPFCLAILDIDHFKQINDTHGHDTGDLVLAAVANVISRQLRSFDDAYRLGGEEFLICLKETGLEHAAQAMERLRAALAETPIAVPMTDPLRVTVSAGLAEIQKEQKLEDLLHAADQALYRAKKAGRDRIMTAGA